jgi:hypothetical protein
MILLEKKVGEFGQQMQLTIVVRNTLKFIIKICQITCHLCFTILSVSFSCALHFACHFVFVRILSYLQAISCPYLEIFVFLDSFIAFFLQED